MKQFALEDRHNRQDLFIATASKMKINADAVEKDFWVCYMIDHMSNMIYGDTPDFDEILSYLGCLEQEIHDLK